MPNATAPKSGKTISFLRHCVVTVARAEESSAMPLITRHVPRIFCASHSSPRSNTAKVDEKIGEVLTIAAARATPMRSIPM